MVKSAQVAKELIGEQRIKRLTGSNCSSMERSFRQISSHLSGRNVMNSSPFLLRF
jgi:hypothetical protein